MKKVLNILCGSGSSTAGLLLILKSVFRIQIHIKKCCPDPRGKMRIRTEGVEKYKDKYQLSFYYLFIFNSFTNFLKQDTEKIK